MFRIATKNEWSISRDKGDSVFKVFYQAKNDDTSKFVKSFKTFEQAEKFVDEKMVKGDTKRFVIL